jgi:hypothetical protein
MNRKMEVHLELRKNAGYDRMTHQRRDAIALVETQTGVTLRWFLEHRNAEECKARIDRGEEV